jgi:large subunit ribosomal protein L31/Ran GTPase-activating protein 1
MSAAGKAATLGPLDENMDEEEEDEEEEEGGDDMGLSAMMAKAGLA